MTFCDHLNNSICHFIAKRAFESESPFEQAEGFPNTTGKEKNYKPQIFLLFSLTTLIIYRFFLFRNKTGKFLDKYSQIPGPSLIGCVYHLLMPEFDLFKLTTELSNKYGRMIKGKIFFMEIVAIMEPSYVKKILNLPKPNGCEKPRLIYDIAAGFTIPRGLIYSEYPVWAPHRKVISRTLLYNGVQKQLKKINVHTKILIKNLLAEADLINNDNNEGISGIGNSPICKLLNATALDVILHIIMDVEITTEAERLEFHKNLTIAKNGSTRRGREPWLLIPPIYWLHPERRRTNKSILEIRKFMKTITERFEKRRKENEQKIVDSHSNESDALNNNKATKCMLEEMMDAGFSAEDIFQETVTMIYAGHETSSWATTFLLLRLALNPDIQEKCRKEVDHFFEKKIISSEGQSSLSSSLDVDLTTVDLNSLEYVDRCMKECLRLTPIIPWFGRKLDVPVELEKDLVLPKGLTVGLFPWIMQRDPDIFHNPEKFDPDRFLPEECAKRHPYSYIPFSAGVRNCLGWKVAPLTIKLVTAFILKHFVIETNDKWEDLEFEYGITMTTKNNVNLVFKRR